MKIIVKKVKKALKFAAIGAVISTTLLAGAVGYSNAKFASYTSNEVVEDNLEYLNCDTDYLKTYKNQYKRMQHNGDNPIYVFIDENYTEQEKLAVQKSLDKVFGILGTINSKYRYKIVDQEEYSKHKNETRITYTLKNEEYAVDGALAQVKSGDNLLTRLTDKKLMNNFIISIDREAIYSTGKENELDLALDHELGHAVCFEDTYEVENREAVFKKNQANTFMNPHYDDVFKTFTPNDVKCWIALYAESKEEVQKLNDGFLKEYEDKYYNEILNDCFIKQKKESDLTIENFKLESLLTVNEIDGSQHGYIYEIVIEGKDYTFAIYDKDTNKMLDICRGAVYNINGVKILQNVELKHGFRPMCKDERLEKGLTQDVVVANFTGGYNGKTTCFYDQFSNWTSFGDVYDLEKTIEN